MNVYCWLRLEYPNASYNEIVKQATLLTGVAPVTIYRWKKNVNLFDPDEKPPPKRRRKNASAASANGVKKVRKSRKTPKKAASGEPGEPGDANAQQNVGEKPKKRQRKKQPVRVGNQASKAGVGAGVGAGIGAAVGAAVGAAAPPAQAAAKAPRKKAVPVARCEQQSSYVPPQPVQPAHGHYEHRQFTRLEPRIPNPNQMHGGQATAQSFDPPTSSGYQSWWTYH